MDTLDRDMVQHLYFSTETSSAAGHQLHTEPQVSSCQLSKVFTPTVSTEPSLSTTALQTLSLFNSDTRE